jgi:hypothetical protein
MTRDIISPGRYNGVSLITRRLRGRIVTVSLFSFPSLTILFFFLQLEGEG